MELFSALGTSSGLAFSSGINAYLPLLIAAIAANPKVQALLHINTNQNLSFLSEDWIILILIVLIILDFFADKIPGMSGLWNGVHTIIRPLTGALASGAMAPSNQPTWLIIFLALGASLATMSHTTKIVTRTTASAATGGIATPIISVLEDIVVLLVIIIAFLASILMFFLSLTLILLFIWFAPRILSGFRYNWRITASFLVWIVNVCIRRKPDARPTDLHRKLSAAERTHLHQILPVGMTMRAGIQLLWIKQRGIIRGKRRIALPTWLLMTDEALIFFPPSQPRKTQVIPYVEVQALKLTKKVSQGRLTVRIQAGPEYTCTILRTSLSAAVETVNILYTHYHLPSDKPVQGAQMCAYHVTGVPPV